MLLSTLLFFLGTFTIQCELIKDPSLKPAEPFSACADSELIRQELDSGKIDRDKIARIIFHRTYDQRHQIDVEYNKKFCPDAETQKKIDYCPFHSAVKDISADSLDNLYDLSLSPPEGILAKVIYESVKKGDCEVGAIEEAVCANDKEMKDRISQYFEANYKITVEDHLATFRKDDQDYQNVLLKYCWKGLSQDKKLTPDDAMKEAQALKDISLKKHKDDFKKKLLELLDTTSEPDLKQIFENYRHDEKGIDYAIKKIFDEDRVIRAYTYLVRYIQNTLKFYVEQLHDTVDSGLSLIIKTRKINRIILTRCERDLLAITKAYHDEYDRTFTNHLHVVILGYDTGKSIRGMY